MAIQDLKVSMTYSGRDIASLSDRPNQDGMSASALKARFDQLNKEVIPNYNDLIDLLDTYIQTNDGDIVALENAINGLGISLGDLDLSVTEVLDAYNSGVLSGVYTGTTEPTDPRIKVWIDPDGQGIVIDETNRVNQEIVRQSNEGTRIANENIRIINENTRISQESSRVNAENTRVTQENARNVYESYNPLTPYVVGNKVSYNGSSYICILDSLGNLPTNTTYWLLIAQKGEQGIQGANTTATNVTNTPSGNISSTTVQGAINELDTEKADKLFATNLVTNGDFSNGTTGWSVISATGFSVVGGIAKFTPTAQYGRIVSQAILLIINNKYYTYADVKTINNDKLGVGLMNGTSSSANTTTVSTISQRVSTVQKANANVNTYVGVLDYRTSLFDEVEVYRIGCINLTQIFGAGKEPTKEQVDWLLAQKYANSWFDGTKELCSITDLLTLVNTKANITQEAWITPTLLNGWTNFEPVGYATCEYYKDQMGIVHARGFIKGGTIGSAIFTFIPGYRVTKNHYFTAYSNDSLAQMTLGTSGDLKCRIGNNTYVAFYIHFRAEA